MGQYYWTGNNTGSGYSDFERNGHPGRYFSVLKHSSGQTDFTGSNYGYGAIMIGSGSSATFGTTDKITLSGGGEILLRDFASIHGTAANELRTSILDISLGQISSSVDSPHIYCFKRQK